MKRIILLLVFSGSCFSQESKFSINGSFGSSIPVGEFASKAPDLNKDSKGNQYAKNGFAKAGININMGLNYYFTKYIGVSVNYDYSRLGVSDEIKKTYSQIIYNNGYGAPNGEAYSNIISTEWQNKFLLVGPSFRISISKLSVYGSIEAGICSIVTPHQSFTENYPSAQSISYDKHQQNINNMAYGISCGLNYSITEKVSIGMNIKSLNTSYKDKSMNYDFKGNSYSLEESRKINIVCLGIGLTYSFK